MQWIRGVGRIPERVTEAVRVIRADGASHAEVLRRFGDVDERRAAAALLSTMLDLGCRNTCNFLHGLLTALCVIMAALYIVDVPLLGIALVAVAILVYARRPWGYRGMALLAIWAVVVAVSGFDELAEMTRGAAVTGIVLTAAMLAAGALALYLRRAMYPYLGLFGIRTDRDGTPILLHALDDTERDTVES